MHRMSNFIENDGLGGQNLITICMLMRKLKLKTLLVIRFLFSH